MLLLLLRCHSASRLEEWQHLRRVLVGLIVHQRPAAPQKAVAGCFDYEYIADYASFLTGTAAPGYCYE